ncbi:hypothetical protein ACFWSF_39135 [Streptomyces sp. NPDC058611]|uniref:hypothetical protein n=1 Tax=unclassified Streptomyces TaxID=2593676 RepID=UPI00364B7B2F
MTGTTGNTGKDRIRPGCAAGAVSGLLAAVAALAVGGLVAAAVRPEASPVTAVGAAVVDRTPPA